MCLRDHPDAGDPGASVSLRSHRRYGFEGYALIAWLRLESPC